MISFESNVKKFRKKKNMTQQGLADATKISRKTIGKIENDEYHTISLEAAYRISDALGRDITEVFVHI